MSNSHIFAFDPKSVSFLKSKISFPVENHQEAHKIFVKRKRLLVQSSQEVMPCFAFQANEEVNCEKVNTILNISTDFLSSTNSPWKQLNVSQRQSIKNEESQHRYMRLVKRKVRALFFSQFIVCKRSMTSVITHLDIIPQLLRIIHFIFDH